MAAVAQHFHRQERHAQEDAKRRKLREDLEGGLLGGFSQIFCQ